MLPPLEQCLLNFLQLYDLFYSFLDTHVHICGGRSSFARSLQLPKEAFQSQQAQPSADWRRHAS